jgi:hypothetical protein
MENHSYVGGKKLSLNNYLLGLRSVGNSNGLMHRRHIKEMTFLVDVKRLF